MLPYLWLPVSLSQVLLWQGTYCLQSGSTPAAKEMSSFSAGWGHTAVTSNDMALQATLHTQPKAPCVAVVTRGCSSSKVWPSVLTITLCGGAGTHSCGDTHAGMLETWAQVPAGCQSLPGQVLQLVPSTLLLPSAQAADEPSLNQLQEPHTMLRLLGITSLKSILAAPQDWAGKKQFIVIVDIILQANRLVWGPHSLLLLSFTRKSAMEPVPSHPAKTSLCPQERSRHWPRSRGHLIAAPSPALAAHWPSCLAQGNVTGHLHVGRWEGLEETGLCSADPSAGAWDINTERNILRLDARLYAVLWMKHWQLNHQKQLGNSGLNFISGLDNQMKHFCLPLMLKYSIFDSHVRREILHL